MFNSTRSVYLILFLYFVILIGIAPINILSPDSYYYWDWSRHLALSYYDGSPMIAYFIWISTSFFGDNLFALSVIGILVTALTSGIIYKTAHLFLSKEASCMAMLSWFFSPLVTLDILKQTTYDSPLTLFWALTIYYSVKFIKTNNIKGLYFIGVSAGLMMLSKYTGIILILSLIIFLVCTPYRSIFKTKHFYFAILIAIFIFSPVIIWNYQHAWQSFIYQLTTHQINTDSRFYNAITTFFNSFVTSLNVMLIPPFIIYHWEVDEKKAVIIKLCRIICFTFLIFFLYTSINEGIRELWLAPYLISCAFLFGYFYEKFRYHSIFVALIILYGVISLFLVIDNTDKYHLIDSKKFVLYQLIQQFNKTYPLIPNNIFTSGWYQARMLYFIKNKPAIYTINCDNEEQNQYAFWSNDLNKQITSKTLKDVLFIDKHDRIHCLSKYFDQCKKIPTETYRLKNKEYALNVYKCQNL